ncbi:MAG TPA: hypothetical protein VK503_11035 [Candidatus Bathyarchaeia archaeon]|nr:hypothetical protein [Candidatus Bathyarchaeia archaeon]
MTRWLPVTVEVEEPDNIGSITGELLKTISRRIGYVYDRNTHFSVGAYT